MPLGKFRYGNPSLLGRIPNNLVYFIHNSESPYCIYIYLT